MKTCWHYDLIYTGGIEQSLASLLEIFKNPNMYVAHREQYFTNEAVCERIKKTSKLIDTNAINEINPDIWILSGVIFDYADIFKKIKAKVKIGWVHFIPGQQLTFENMLLYPEYTDQIDYWVCVSEVAKKGLLKYIPNANVRIIHNIIDEEKIKKLSNIPINIEKKDDEITFVSSCRLSKEKGIYEGIELMKKLKEANIKAKWYLIGSCLSSQLADDIEEAKKEYNIITPGYLSNPYNIIKQCDYGLLLSKNESWSIFVDECHILGVPTITNDFEAIHERKNCDKIGIILKNGIDDLNLEELFNKRQEFKNNLKSYKYQNDIDLWYKLFDEIKATIK